MEIKYQFSGTVDQYILRRVFLRLHTIHPPKSPPTTITVIPIPIICGFIEFPAGSGTLLRSGVGVGIIVVLSRGVTVNNGVSTGVIVGFVEGEDGVGGEVSIRMSRLERKIASGSAD